MLDMRRARPGDARILTELAVRSEAYCGYDAAFMANFRKTYRVTAAFLGRHVAFVAEQDGAVVGFYALAQEETGLELEYLYLEPSRIG